MIEFATPIPSPKMPKPTSPLAKLGLAYERKVVRALRESAPAGIFIEPNPWYEYSDEAGTHVCSPDILIIDEGEGYGIVAEVKLNWTPLAIQKLSELYCPIMNYFSQTSGIAFKPLVITKNLTPESPRPQPRLTWAFNANVPLFHWPGLGSVLW
jgi:hypothetical protein